MNIYIFLSKDPGHNLNNKRFAQFSFFFNKVGLVVLVGFGAAVSYKKNMSNNGF